MLFAQILNDDLGCASYLVGCEEAGEAVVVDPPYAIEDVVAAAERLEVRVVRTIETHTHADHVSGHGRLALEHGIPVSIHPAAQVAYPHDALEDGGEVTVGNVKVRCIHTPGHRPEHCCLAVIDRTRADEPWLVLTGDSLFVGDTARPDLAVEAAEGAEGLFHSLRRLMELPDGVEVFPGHVAGSLCGVAMSSRGSTTIGFERRFNPMPRSRTGLVRGRVGRGVGAEAAEPRSDRRAQPRAVPRQPAACEGACRARAGLTAARRPPGLRPPCRPSARCGQRPDLGHELLDQGGVRARCVDTGHRPRRGRGRGRAGRRRPALVALLDVAGYVLGGGPRDDREGDGRRLEGRSRPARP